jgi:hypothetical protein
MYKHLRQPEQNGILIFRNLLIRSRMGDVSFAKTVEPCKAPRSQGQLALCQTAYQEGKEKIEIMT